MHTDKGIISTRGLALSSYIYMDSAFEIAQQTKRTPERINTRETASVSVESCTRFQLMDCNYMAFTIENGQAVRLLSRVEFLGGCFLIGVRVMRWLFGFVESVTAFVLLAHAIDEKHDQRDHE